MTDGAGPQRRLRLPGGLAALGYPSFSIYWAGFLTANTGKWAELTGAVWLAYELTSSPVLVGLIGLVRAVPAIILSPIGGVVADRLDQRRILFGTQALSFLASTVLTWLVVSGQVQLWQLYLQVGLQSAIQAVDNSARQALFPRLVPRDALLGAVTLQSTAARLSSLFGPTIGGLAIAALGEPAPFGVNAVSNVMLMAALLNVRHLAPRLGAATTSFRAELSEGFRYLMGHPVLGALLRMETVFAVFQVNPVIITIIAREILDVGPEGLGLLLGADSIGATFGIAFLLTRGPGARQGRFILLSTIAYALALVLVAASPAYLLAFLALTVVGFFDALVAVTRNALMQWVAPGGMRGRVMANVGMVTRGVGPLAQVQSGLLAAALGPPLAVLAAAVALAVNAAIYARPGHPLWTFRGQADEDVEADREVQPGLDGLQPGLDGPHNRGSTGEKGRIDR